jgi:mannosyltransferase
MNVASLRSIWPWFAVSGLVLLSLVLRIWQVNESLWIDELHTAWCATGTLGQVAPRAAIGNQSPVFFWLEWLLVRVIGVSEASLRLPSVIAGSLLPLAVFLFGRRWSLGAVGLVAAALLAIDPQSIFYATEARPYAVLQLLAIAHIALTMEIATQPRRDLRLVWVGVAATLFHLHYTAALLIAAESVFLAILPVAPRLQSPYRITSLFCDLALVGLLCLPAADNVQTVFAHRANWAAFIQLQPLWDAVNWTPLPAWWWAILAVVASVGIGRRLKIGVNPEWLGRSSFVFLVICWLTIPIAIAWLATWTESAHLFFARYLVCAFPAAMLFAGLCVYAAPAGWVRLTIGLLTIGVAAWSSGIIPQLVHDGRVIGDRNEDWRGCVAWLNKECPHTQFPVLVWSGLIEADRLRQPHDELLEDYCLLPVTSLYLLDIERTDMFPLPLHEPGHLDQVAEMLAVHRGGAWLIVRGRAEISQQVAAAVLARLRQSSMPEGTGAWSVQEWRSFGRVHVLRIGVPDTGNDSD